MSRMTAPAFLSNLYRDLRDRRLLLPIILLAAALVAVPVLLSSSPEPPAPQPALDVAAIDGAAAVQPAVLAEQSGIRNYRKRLRALKEKNPFEQQYAIKEGAAGDDSGTSTGAGTATSAAASTLSTGTSTPPDASTPPTDIEPPVTVKIPRERHVTKKLTYRVDVTLGPLGDTKKYKNVHRLDLLPSDEEPVVAFFGVSSDQKRAAFLVSGAVASSDGDGRCAPSPEQCSFVTLKVGDQRFLHLQPEEGEEQITYRLRLVRVREAIVKGSREVR